MTKHSRIPHKINFKEIITMTNTIKRAIEIFKAEFPEARGKFGAHVQGNTVEIMLDGTRYAVINVVTSKVKAD
jgi:hypothetical protein